MQSINISCVISLRGKLSVYEILPNGKKKKINNIFATQCSNKEDMRECPHRKSKDIRYCDFPCRYKNTIFFNLKEFRDYRKMKKNRPKGQYRKKEREIIVQFANMELEDEVKH